MTKAIIAIDAMGGDHGTKITVPAAISMLEQHPDLTIILVGDQDQIQQRLNGLKKKNHPNLQVHPASQVVAMDESPAVALRTKKDSSMRVAIDLVKEGKAQACVSAGNTGALMATARFVLKTLPGIDRPAISTCLPTLTQGKEVRVLDLGANVDSTPEILFQFAVMGSVVSKAIDNIHEPKVALLNIGEEEIKGNELVKQTAQRLIDCKDINYVGYIEGDKVFSGNVDVVICDGFIGNILLKVTEGVARLLGHHFKQAFLQSFYARLVALLAKPLLNGLRKQLDPGQRNGATLLGLQGTVIKSHGGADSAAFANAIEEALREIEKNIPERIHQEVSSILNKS